MTCPYFQVPDNAPESCYTEDLRYLNTNNTVVSRELYSNWFLEQIAQYGIQVQYQQTGYSLELHDSVYGEHPTQMYGNESNLIMYVSFNSDSILLGNFGFASDADITCFVHISAFRDTFGLSAEPEAGDIITLTEYGNTGRPNGRGPAKFEVTRRDDEDLNQINPLIGHYVWLIRAKRYDYSYENNVSPEKRINQINDDSYATSLSSYALSSDYVKTYTQEIDALGIEIFDYDVDNPESNNAVYGDY